MNVRFAFPSPLEQRQCELAILDFLQSQSSRPDSTRFRGNAESGTFSVTPDFASAPWWRTGYAIAEGSITQEPTGSTVSIGLRPVIHAAMLVWIARLAAVELLVTLILVIFATTRAIGNHEVSAGFMMFIGASFLLTSIHLLLLLVWRLKYNKGCFYLKSTLERIMDARPAEKAPR